MPVVREVKPTLSTKKAALRAYTLVTTRPKTNKPNKQINKLIKQNAAAPEDAPNFWQRFGRPRLSKFDSLSIYLSITQSLTLEINECVSATHPQAPFRSRQPPTLIPSPL